MKFSVVAAVILTASTTTANAQSMVGRLCGIEHVNETFSSNDVRANPDGYYIESLGIQLSHGDARIIYAVGKTYRLCTREAVTPAMNDSNFQGLGPHRVVSYLFVPVCEVGKKPTS